MGSLPVDVAGSGCAAKILRFLQFMIKPFSVCIVAPKSEVERNKIQSMKRLSVGR